MGLPGNGKTTTSKLLEQKLYEYIRFNAHDMREELGLPRYDTSKDGSQEEEKVEQYLQELHSKIIQGKGLIVDRAGTMEKFRSYVYDWAKHYGVEELVIYHNVPKEIAKKGIQDRDPGLEYVGENAYQHNDPRIFDRYIGQWESPIKDLDEDKYPHVSMVMWNYKTHSFEEIRVSENIRPLVQAVQNLLSTHSPSKN